MVRSGLPNELSCTFEGLQATFYRDCEVRLGGYQESWKWLEGGFRGGYGGFILVALTEYSPRHRFSHQENYEKGVRGSA